MNQVKNYVVCAHRRIKSTKWVWKDTKDEGDIYEIYREMCLHSLASARHFLEGEWEYILWDQEIDHINDAMPLNNQLTYDLWHKEPCNILWIGPDVQFVKPTKIFGEFTDSDCSIGLIRKFGMNPINTMPTLIICLITI